MQAKRNTDSKRRHVNKSVDDAPVLRFNRSRLAQAEQFGLRLHFCPFFVRKARVRGIQPRRGIYKFVFQVGSKQLTGNVRTSGGLQITATCGQAHTLIAICEKGKTRNERTHYSDQWCATRRWSRLRSASLAAAEAACSSCIAIGRTESLILIKP